MMFPADEFAGKLQQRQLLVSSTVVVQLLGWKGGGVDPVCSQENRLGIDRLLLPRPKVRGLEVLA